MLAVTRSQGGGFFLPAAWLGHRQLATPYKAEGPASLNAAPSWGSSGDGAIGYYRGVMKGGTEA